ncbi:MAG: tRNA 2-thiouridine synthesizing protein D [Gammaproteobacteria bacterium]|jgi:tRNA 2-thiouridine synthesizing protein D
MKFTVQVNTGPFTHQGSDTAYQFTKAALEDGHKISRVFFYHDGVNNSTFFPVPPKDDRNLQALWSDLAKQHDLEMIVCIAAAQRRGIMDQSESERHGKGASNIADGFEISGLGQLIEAVVESDRTLVFGD